MRSGGPLAVPPVAHLEGQRDLIGSQGSPQAVHTSSTEEVGLYPWHLTASRVNTGDTGVTTAVFFRRQPAVRLALMSPGFDDVSQPAAYDGNVRSFHHDEGEGTP